MHARHPLGRHRSHAARSVVAGAWVVAVGLAWAPSALAHPGYPTVVDSTLALTKKVETILPPRGCQLCHNSSAGGDQLKAFGSLLVSTYGLSTSLTEADPSLEVALMGLKGSDPAAVEDLQRGLDPNTDSTVFAAALPTPEYGCSAGGLRARSTRDRVWWIGVLIALASGTIARRRRALEAASHDSAGAA